MIEQIANPITFSAFYSASKAGKTGLTLTVDVYRGATKIITAGTATGIGGGLYSYTLAGGSVTTESSYYAVFHSTDSTVDQQDIPALWTVGVAGVEDLDVAVSTRSTYSGGAVASVAAPVTVGTNTDKTGYSGTATNLPADYQQRGIAVTLPSLPAVTLATGQSIAASNLPGDYARANVAPTWYTAPDNSDVATALGDLVTLIGRTDPTSALSALATATAAIKAEIDAAPQILLANPYVPTTAPVLVIPQPSDDATLCTVYGYLETPQGAVAAGVQLTFTLATPGAIKGNRIVSGRSVTATTNTAGYLQVLLERNDLLTPSGSRWTVTSAALGWRSAKSFTVAATTLDLASIV